MRNSPPLVFADPLATARLYLQLNPNERENRALRHLLQAIADGHGTLHAPDSVLFSGELGELTAALLDAMQQGRYHADEWRELPTTESPPDADSPYRAFRASVLDPLPDQ